jgi:hypothetical protein
MKKVLDKRMKFIDNEEFVVFSQTSGKQKKTIIGILTFYFVQDHDFMGLEMECMK